MARKVPEAGWNISEAIASLRARVDPYIWEQGQELFRRGAVEDFQLSQDGTIHVTVLDPRDARRFFVKVERERHGGVRVRCECPYRLGGSCRHQVVALEYLRSVAEGAAAAGGGGKRDGRGERGGRGGGEGRGERREVAGRPGADAPVEEAAPPTPEEPVLYRLAAAAGGVTTCPDGSLLRVVLLSLGSSRSPTRIGLQLYTGTGWTELRTGDVDRWIARGAAGPHPRDALLAGRLTADGAPRREVDADGLAGILAAAAGSDSLVDRAGRTLPVSLWPYRLEARLERGEPEGLAVRFRLRPPTLERADQGTGGQKGAAGRDPARGGPVPLEEVGLVPSVSPWIQLEDGTFHPLIAGVPGSVLGDIQEAAVGGAFASVVGGELDRLLSEGIERLERACAGALETEPGAIEEVEGVSGARLRLVGTPARLEGTLELLYGDGWVDAERSRSAWTATVDGVVRRYPPAGGSLARAHRELETLGFAPSAPSAASGAPPAARWTIQGPAALLGVLAPRPGAFVRVVLPAKLEALDLVERSPSVNLAVRPVASGEGPSAPPAQGGGPMGEASGTVGSGGRPRSGIAWLEVTPTLADGDRVLPVDVAALRRAFEADPDGLVQLRDGTVLSLRHETVRSLAALSAEGSLTDDGRAVRIRLSRLGALLDDLPGRTVDLDREVAGLFRGLRGGPVPEEVGLASEVETILRPYQRDAVRWLGHLAAWGLGGILADEMGLGKTLMSLAHLFGRPDPESPRAPVLVVCPSSLVFNWLDEARRFFPGLRAVGLHGEAAEERARRIAEGADLVVTSYALLRRDREALEAREFRAVVLDEAQKIKNAESQTAQAAFALRAPERWALTGTPVENHLGELWSLFRFLMPGFLDAADAFAERYTDPIARGDEGAFADLHRRVRPFVLRRTKGQVLADLPPKIEQVERVPMTPEQLALYQATLAAARGELEGADPTKARFHILAALTRLRQICCHPRLVLEKGGKEAVRDEEPEGLAGGKFLLLRELLESCLEEGHRVLLYSQFTSMLDIIEELLGDLGVERCRLDGSTRDREGEVRRFARSPSIPVFLISLQAGGLGLNLTQADTVIIYDPWWNPAAEAQAAARAHRLGQTAPVHVHKLVVRDTVEERILELQSRKRDLAERLVEGGEEALAALSFEEIRGLILP